MTDKRIKLEDVQVATFWNDTHKLTLLFQPLEEEIPPPEPVPEVPNIPTGITVTFKEPEIELPNIPTNISASTITDNIKTIK